MVGKKCKIEVPGINQWNNEGPFSENINPVEIKVGDRYYLDIAPIFSFGHNWKLIEITYVRGNVIFYKFPDEPNKPEEWVPIGCVGMNLGMFQYIEYVVDTKKYPVEYNEWACRCPLTKIIYK